MANSIFAKLLGQGDYLEYPAATGAAIEPGMGLERITESGETVVQPVSTADANSTLIAREQRNPPRMGDGNPVDQAYSGGDNVESRSFQEAEEARLRLAAGTDLATAANANVSAHDELGWNSDGTLVKGGSNPKYEALEAVDNSAAASGEHALILVKQLE
ncbi:hypothetical protein [Natrinema soli]|uniref:Uncharacterized protein n=1 Tax=Natrinema soli TaxID=1930624 RepID=A0ABD5SLU6_9EURY|nr:hypothetical protein [Natrinema soli]